MHIGETISRLRHRLGDDREMIYRYLAEEVLSKLPSELQRVTLHPAVVPDLTSELCDEVSVTDWGHPGR